MPRSSRPFSATRCDRLRAFRYLSDEGDKPITAFIVAVHILASLLLIVFILLHAGRGGGLSGMLFGGGMEGLGGSSVTERNLDRMTVAAAVIFGITTVLLILRLN